MSGEITTGTAKGGEHENRHGPGETASGAPLSPRSPRFASGSRAGGEENCSEERRHWVFCVPVLPGPDAHSPPRPAASPPPCTTLPPRAPAAFPHPARARRLARLACRGRRDPSVLLAHVAPGSPIRHSEGAHEGRGGLAQHRHLNILKTKIVAPLKKKEHMFLSRSSLPPCVTYQDLGLRS